MGLKLGDISPVAGIMSGEGAIGKLADKGLLGLGPRMIASKAQEKDEAKAMQAMQAEKNAAAAEKQKKEIARQKYISAARAPTGGMEGYKAMKKGGKVSSASSRADGCCVKGKTKGRMV